MPRHAALSPRQPVKVYLTEENLAQLRLATFSALKGKPQHGATSDIVNQALEAYFSKENRNVQSGDSQQA
jgi:hypothetical protein